MNRKRLFATQEPPPLGTLAPELVKTRPVVRIKPQSYPFRAVPIADPDGIVPPENQIKALIKELGRKHRVRIEWQHSASTQSQKPQTTPVTGEGLEK
jgi:hypothetical protein